MTTSLPVPVPVMRPVIEALPGSSAKIPPCEPRFTGPEILMSPLPSRIRPPEPTVTLLVTFVVPAPSRRSEAVGPPEMGSMTVKVPGKRAN